MVTTPPGPLAQRRLLFSGIVRSVHMYFDKILKNFNRHVVDYMGPGRRGLPLPAAVVKLVYAPR